MRGRFGTGLRTQILLVLLVSVSASFALLGFAAIGLSKRVRRIDAQRSAGALASSFAAFAERVPPGDIQSIEARAAELVSQHVVQEVEVELPDAFVVRVGKTAGSGVRGESRTRSGIAVRMVAAAPELSSGAALRSLLVLYSVVTGGAILLLAYLFLTFSIVQPVQRLIHASAALAEGRAAVRVRPRGAAEVAQLASAFNHMADELEREKKTLEERLAELERATSELRTTQGHLVRSEKLASVGRLAAGVAHEIGNPLAAILGLVELLQGGGLKDSDQQEFLRRIHKETHRIHKIIRDLLDYARQGSAAEQSEATDLAEIVEEAVRLVAPQKNLRDVTIERRLFEGTPHVRGEGHKLTQIVLNLLLNAADAIEGHGTIVIEVRPAETNRVALCVSDTGPGIDPAVIDHVFEPFVTTKPPGEGTGLGLAVCLALVEALGGSISATNPPSGGARFEVKLPTVG